MTPAGPSPGAPLSGALAAVGTAGVAVAVVLFGLLHVVPPSSRLDPARRTISQYALLDNGWTFDLAVVILAVGSLAILAALVSARLIAVASGTSAGLMLWSAGLIGVVWFQKHNWAVGASIEGSIHRAASVVAFLSLPIAALLAARGRLRHPRWGSHARATATAALLSLLCLVPVVVAIIAQRWTGVPWWRAIPLGGVERALGLCEVVTMLLLAQWALRAGGRVSSRTAATPYQPV